VEAPTWLQPGGDGMRSSKFGFSWPAGYRRLAANSEPPLAIGGSLSCLVTLMASDFGPV
jgi:hypothetical protein